MGTKGYEITFGTNNWSDIKVTDVKYDSYDYEAPSVPTQLVGVTAQEGGGPSSSVHLEVYNGANGAAFNMTIQVADAWEILIRTDPRELWDILYQEKHQTRTVCPVKVISGDKDAPPTVYANFSGDSSSRRVEYVVAREADGLLADSGELACTPAEVANYKKWLSEVNPDTYKHHDFNGIPMAVNPPDDRGQGNYNLRRNASKEMVELAADLIRWKLGSSNVFFYNLPMPKGATPNLYASDEWFGKFPFMGPDPTTIEVVKGDAQLPASLSSSARKALEKSGKLPPDFEAALASGNVLRVDFTRYAQMQIQTKGRFACWPMAIYINRVKRGGDGFDHGTTLPVAIDLQFPKAPGVTVFAAGNDHPTWTWENAKRLFLCAAANYHELGSHLGRTHLVMERYALATYRKLPPWHPVGRLLRPHFKFMVATNHDAVENLINPGGPVDLNFMAGVQELMPITADAFKTWDLRVHGGLESDLERRGVSKLIHRYRYRDYGLGIYKAIRQFVESYLRLWYGTNNVKLAADQALSTWNGALASDYGVQNGSLPLTAPTLDSLVTACTNIIWTCGPQHSAVNYAQYDFLGDAQTLPFGNYVKDMQFQPTPRDRISDQAAVITRLAAFRFDQLGHYSTDSSLTEYGDLGLPNAAWGLVVDSFQGDVNQAMSYFPRGETDLWAYPFFLPENMTNGISI